MGKRKLIVIIVPVIVALVVAGVIAGVIILGATAQAPMHQTPQNFAASNTSGDVMVSSESYNPDQQANVPVIDTPNCDFNSLVGQSVKTLDRSVFSDRVVRVLHPNDPATMDYSPSRINIIIDDHDVITEVKCG